MKITQLKNKLLRFSLLFASLVSLVSCQDFFIKELDIPRQELDNQLVIHGFISDQDTSLYFKISNNFSLDKDLTAADSLIAGARVYIFQNGDLLADFGQNNKGEYRYDIPEGQTFPPGNYRVEVHHPDYDIAVVETEMPSIVVPESVVFTKDGGFAGPNGQNKLDLIEVSFTDPADEENYYEFQVNQILVDYEILIFPGDTIILETRYPDNYFTPDTNFEQGVSGFLLSDKTFNGQTYSFQIMLPADEEIENIPLDKLKVTWNSISKDHYEYAKSLLQYQRSNGFGLFSDPVAVFSNVENGLGIISFRSKRIVNVQEK